MTALIQRGIVGSVKRGGGALFEAVVVEGAVPLVDLRAGVGTLGLPVAVVTNADLLNNQR